MHLFDPHKPLLTDIDHANVRAVRTLEYCDFLEQWFVKEERELTPAEQKAISIAENIHKGVDAERHTAYLLYKAGLPVYIDDTSIVVKPTPEQRATYSGVQVDLHCKGYDIEVKAFGEVHKRTMHRMQYFPKQHKLGMFIGRSNNLAARVGKAFYVLYFRNAQDCADLQRKLGFSETISNTNPLVAPVVYERELENSKWCYPGLTAKNRYDGQEELYVDVNYLVPFSRLVRFLKTL